MKKFMTLLALALLLGAPFYTLQPVHAATTSYTANETWNDTTCNGAVNGQQDIYVGLASGDTVNLNIVNNSNQQLQVGVSNNSTSYLLLNPGDSTSKTYTVSQELDVWAEALNCSPAGNTTHLYFMAGSGSLSCSITGNQVWNLSGDFNNVMYETYLYRGSTYVEHYYAKGNQTSVDGTEFSAQTTAQTYYLYNGTSSSAPLIGQATCPAKTVSSTTVSGSKSSTSTKSGTAPTTPVTTNAPAGNKGPASATTTATPSKSSAPKLNAVKANTIRPPTKPKGAFWPLLAAGIALALLLIGAGWKIFFQKTRRPSRGRRKR